MTFEYVVLQDHVIHYSHYIFTTKVLIATKLDRMVTKLEGFLPTSFGPLITWSWEIAWQTKTIYLHYHNAYGQKAWQDGVLPWATSTHKVTWPYNHVVLQDHVTNWKHIFSTMSMATKPGRIVTYLEWVLPIKSRDHKSRGLAKSRAKLITLYIHYHDAYGSQTW